MRTGAAHEIVSSTGHDLDYVWGLLSGGTRADESLRCITVLKAALRMSKLNSQNAFSIGRGNVKTISIEVPAEVYARIMSSPSLIS
jgi:hypothetical protein